MKLKILSIFNGKIRGKKLASFFVIAILLLGLINPKSIVDATAFFASSENSTPLLHGVVKYNDDHSKATIEFNLDSIDKEKYDLVNIISNKDNKVVYDKNTIEERNKNGVVIYETIENGVYDFTIKYVENQNKDFKEDEIGIESTDNTQVETNETSTDTEEIDKFNQDMSGTSSVEKHNVTEQSESNVVQEDVQQNKSKLVQNEKSEKVIVNVDGIESPSVSKEVENNSNENEEVLPNYENDLSSALSEETRDSVNLNDEFYFSGTLQDDNDAYYEITDDCYSVLNNKVILGNPFSNYKRQTVVLTNKNSIDYNRSFSLKGKFNISSKPEGFAIAFHNQQNYVSRKASGGSLGIYEDSFDTSSGAYGIEDALVAEIDTHNNTGNSVHSIYGDDPRYPEGQSGKHLSVCRTNYFGTVERNLIQRYGNEVNTLLNKEISFEILWDSTNNKFTFNFGNVKMEATDSEIGNKLKSSPGYYTIGTGLNYNIGGGGNRNSFIFEEFKYIDASPNISTNYKVESGKTHAISNEKVTITHEIWNGKQSSVELKDVLNLKEMRIDSIGSDLQISNVKAGYDLSSLESKVFDKDTPLEVKYPANQKKYYVQYDVKVPQLNNYGNIDKLNCEVLLGQKGMSQVSSSKIIDIKNRPALYAKKDGTQIINSEIIKVTSPSEVNKELLWRNLYAKVASDSLNEYEIQIEDSGSDTMKFEWEYQVNGSKVDRYPEQIEKGNIYSLKLKIIDKSDDRLNNEFNRTVIVEEDMVQVDDYYIYAENSKSISETKLVTLTVDEFKKYVKTESKAKAFKVNLETGLIENKDIEVKLDGWLDNQGEPYKLPGNSTIELYVAEKPSVKKVIGQEVTANTWSYDTEDRTEENGASGFIVIPKVVNLEKGSGNKKDKLLGKADVYFADYTASDVIYKLYIDKTFKLIKDGDANSNFTVTTVGRNTVTGNKMSLGEINYNHDKDRPIKVDFEASREEVDKSKGRWKGNVKFYFERVR